MALQDQVSVAGTGRVPLAPAYSGFPVELSGVGTLHAALLNESRTRGCQWCPVQEIRGPKKMGAALRRLLLVAQQALSETSHRESWLP
jgi:hypothetical protein